MTHAQEKKAVDAIVSKITGAKNESQREQGYETLFATLSKNQALIQYVFDRFFVKYRNEWELQVAHRILNTFEPLPPELAPALLESIGSRPDSRVINDAVLPLARLVNTIPLEVYKSAIQQHPDVSRSMVEYLVVNLGAVSDPNKRLEVFRFCLSHASSDNEEIRGGILGVISEGTPAAQLEIYCDLYEETLGIATRPEEKMVLLLALVENQPRTYRLEDKRIQQLAKSSRLARWYLNEYKEDVEFYDAYTKGRKT